MDKVSLIILAAGNSERMNFPKALLPWDESSCFLDEIAGKARSIGIEEITAVMAVSATNYMRSKGVSFQSKITIVENLHPEKGRLHSLKLGLAKVNAGHSCFVINVDNPFVPATIYIQLYSVLDDNLSIVPVYHGKGGHPVLIGSKACELIREIQPTDGILKEVLEQIGTKRIDVDTEKIHININTIEDYIKFFGVDPPKGLS